MTVRESIPPALSAAPPPPVGRPPRRRGFSHGRPGQRLGALLAAALAAASLTAAIPGCAGRRPMPRGAQVPDAQRQQEATTLAAEAGRTRDPDKAIQMYQQSLGIWREFPSAWNNMGVLLMQQERYGEALDAF